MTKTAILFATMIVMVAVSASASDYNEAMMAIKSGKIKLEVNDYKGAVKDLTKAIMFDAKDANVFFLRGKAFFQLGKNEEAIKDFTVAIALNPKNPEYYFQKALALADQEDYKLAYREMNKAINLNHHVAAYYYVRANIEVELGYVSDAEDDFEKAASMGYTETKGVASAK